MAFDPDAYLAGSGGTAVADFNPDAYLGIEEKKKEFNPDEYLGAPTAPPLGLVAPEAQQALGTSAQAAFGTAGPIAAPVTETPVADLLQMQRLPEAQAAAQAETATPEFAGGLEPTAYEAALAAGTAARPEQPPPPPPPEPPPAMWPPGPETGEDKYSASRAASLGALRAIPGVGAGMAAAAALEGPNAAISAFTGPAAPFTMAGLNVLEFLGGMVIGNKVAKKGEDAIAAHSQTIRDAQEAARQHPLAEMVGGQIPMAPFVLKSAKGYYDIARSAKTASAAAKAIAKQVAGGSAAGAGMETSRPYVEQGINYLGQQMGFTPDQIQQPTTRSYLENIAIGAALAGHVGGKTKGGDIYGRGEAKTAAAEEGAAAGGGPAAPQIPEALAGGPEISGGSPGEIARGAGQGGGIQIPAGPIEGAPGGGAGTPTRVDRRGPGGGPVGEPTPGIPEGGGAGGAYGQRYSPTGEPVAPAPPIAAGEVQPPPVAAAPVELRDTKVPVGRGVFSRIGVERKNVFADYAALQRKHSDIFVNPQDVRDHVEYVMARPDEILPANQPDHRLIVRSNGVDRAVALEVELRGGKYRVRSAYILDPRQLEKLRSAASVATPTGSRVDPEQAQETPSRLAGAPSETLPADLGPVASDAPGLRPSPTQTSETFRGIPTENLPGTTPEVKGKRPSPPQQSLGAPLPTSEPLRGTTTSTGPVSRAGPEVKPSPAGPEIPGAMGAASIHEKLASYEQRGFAERVQADQSLAAEVRDASGNRYYEPIPHVQTAAEADALVQQRGPLESVKIITDPNNGLEFRHRVTMGLNVMRRLNAAYENLKTTDPAAANRILDAQADVSEFTQEFGTRLAQGLNSFKLWQAMGPDGKLRQLQNQIKRTRDKFTAEHGDAVAEIIDQANQSGDTHKQKESLIERAANRIAATLSDTPTFQKLQKSSKGQEALALIRAHLKSPQPEFVPRLIELGAEPPLAAQINRMASENRRRIELAARVTGIQRRQQSIARIADRIARHLSDTPDLRRGGANADPARELIRQHLLKPQPDFVDNLVKLGADRKTAETIDRMAAENRRRVQAVDRELRVRALEKLYTNTKNPVARAIPKPMWRKIVELADAGLLDNNSFYDVAGKRLGLPALDQVGRREMARLANEVQAAPEGIPKDKATLKFSRYVSSKIGFAPKDLPLSIYYGNLLSGYNTHIVNFLDTLLNVKSEVGTLALSEPEAAAKIYHGALRDFLSGRHDAMKVLTEGRMVTDGKFLESPRFAEVAKFGTKGGVPISEKSVAGRVFKRVAESKIAYPLNAWKYTTRLLGASDTLLFRAAEGAHHARSAFRAASEEGLTGRALNQRVEELLGQTRAQRAGFEQQAGAEGLKGGEFKARVEDLRRQTIRQDAREDARDFAGRATYNHEPEGMLGEAAKVLGRYSEKYPALKAFVPFTQIVANVTNRGLNYTPLGFKRAFRGYSGGKPLTGDARHAMLMRASLGTTGLATLWAMQAAGKIGIHGAGPSDPEKRRQLTSAGWKPYSLQVGNKFYNYTYTPLGLGLAAIGNFSDSYRYKEMDQKDALTRGIYALTQGGSTIMSQSFLSGLNNLFRALSDQGGSSVASIRSALSQFAGAATTPAAVRDLWHVFDTKRYKGDSIAGDLLRNTPFASLVNRPVLNAFGEPVRPNTNRFVSQISDDPAWQKVLKYNLRVPVPDKYTDMPDGKGGMRQITPEEYYDYLHITGPMIKDLVAGMEFQNVPPELGQKMLSEAARTVRSEVLEALRMQAAKKPAD